jgi:hypothetical protein
LPVLGLFGPLSASFFFFLFFKYFPDVGSLQWVSSPIHCPSHCPMLKVILIRMCIIIANLTERVAAAGSSLTWVRLPVPSTEVGGLAPRGAFSRAWGGCPPGRGTRKAASSRLQAADADAAGALPVAGAPSGVGKGHVGGEGWFVRGGGGVCVWGGAGPWSTRAAHGGGGGGSITQESRWGVCGGE